MWSHLDRTPTGPMVSRPLTENTQHKIASISAPEDVGYIVVSLPAASVI